MTDHLEDEANLAETESRTPRSAPSPSYHRRGVLKAAGAIVAVGGLAGCTAPGEPDDGDSQPDSVDEWLSNTRNYDSIADLRGQASVTVEVGAPGNSGANAFAPAAIRVAPGTTVTWEWVDGYHNVVATDGEFDSGSAEQNGSFEYAFDAAGTFYYFCDPHRSLDMKGAVVVDSADDDLARSSPR